MGHRLGAPLPKALVQVGGKTLVEHAVANASAIADEVVVTAPAGFEDQYRALLGDEVKVLTAGILRSDSVRVGLANVTGEFILVHDAARALATPAMMQRVIDALKSGAKAVIPALPVVDTIKVIDGDGNVASTPSRESLRVAQTPQGFVQDVLRLAHSKGEDASDCASMVEGHGIKVHTVLGEDLAMKITILQILLLPNVCYLEIQQRKFASVLVLMHMHLVPIPLAPCILLACTGQIRLELMGIRMATLQHMPFVMHFYQQLNSEILEAITV